MLPVEALTADVVRAVREHAAVRPDHLAVKDSRTSLSYAELLNRVTASAGALARHGVRPGDRVGIHLENSADYVATVLACLAAGAVFVPIPYSDPADRICRIAHDCAVRLTVVPTGREFPARWWRRCARWCSRS